MAKKRSTCTNDALFAGYVALPNAIQEVVAPFLGKEVVSKVSTFKYLLNLKHSLR
jgi:hypothetical protein